MRLSRATYELLTLACVLTGCARDATELQSLSGLAQGTTYSLQWVGGAGESEVAAAADRELERVDALLSNYRSDSVLERFNAQRSSEPVELPSELVTLFAVAKTIHEASEGCFDPTVRPLVRAWGFDTDTPAVPTAAALEVARASIGLNALMIDAPDRVHKTKPALEVDMASLGQGYSAGRLAELLEAHGSENYLAEIGGEIVARGAKPDGSPWRVGVEDPSDEGVPGAAMSLSPDRRTAVITSGTYRQFFDGTDRRYGHIIDPRTGVPVDHDLLSVTVVGSDASRTAAWATALLCLGPERAIAVAEREGLAAVLWVADARGNAVRQDTRALTSGLAGAALQ